jgi:hypothetical protein
VVKVTRDVDQATADRIADTVRKIFRHVLKELADLDNPMRTPIGSEDGEGGLFGGDGIDGPFPDPGSGSPGGSPTDPSPHDPDPPDVSDELNLPAEADSGRTPSPARPDRHRSSDLPSIAPDPDPGNPRSRFDEAAGVVLYNERHADYLLVKDDEPAPVDYLATLVAKEYVVYNNPRAAPEELAEEMVRMLVRVRRHLRRR